MNIRVESAGPCRREVHIEVPLEKVRAAFEETAAAYARHARIPGFRPGKAPKELIRRRFQKEIASDVKEQLIPQAYRAAIEQEKLSTEAVVDIKEQTLDESRPFAFSVVVDVAPDFDLPAYKGIPLQRKAITVEEKDIDEVLAKIRDQNARYEDVQGRPVQIGDLVQIDYEGVSEGRPVEELAPNAKGLGQGRDFWLMADEQNEFLPGFARALVGAQLGERREVHVDFPADFAETSLAGRKASYFVTVKALRAKQPFELDEEFLKGVGVESMDAMRARVRADLMQLRERNETRRLKDEIVRHLLDSTVFEVPESILQHETRQTVYDLVRHNQRRGVSAEEIESHKEELFDDATRSATEKIKLRYILRKIAAEEKLTVDQQEVDARIRALAAGWGVPVERLRADLEKREAMDQIRDEVLMDKVVNRLLELAAISPMGAPA